MTQPSEPCPDLEDLAALADGRLAEKERARVLDHVAGCEACYEVFAETARLREDLATSEEATEDPPRSAAVLTFPVLRRRVLSVAALAAAAVLAVVVWRPWSVGVDVPPSLATLTEAVVERGDVTSQLGTDWARLPWPSLERGPGERLDAPARDLRLGARTADLDVALAGGDRALAKEVVAELLVLLKDDVPLSQPLIVIYGDLRARLLAGEPLAQLVAAGRDAADRLGRHPEVSERFFLGQWAATGRLAAANGIPEHFTRPEVRHPLHLLEASSEPRRTIAERMAGELSAEDLAALEKAFTAVLRGTR